MSGLKYVKEKSEKLLLFEGIKDLDDIWCYDINTNKWSLLDIKMKMEFKKSKLIILSMELIRWFIMYYIYDNIYLYINIDN